MALGPRDREAIVSTVLSIVREFFVHRRMKTALHGVDIVPLLDALRRRAASMADDDFHAELRRIVVRLRDRHTRYLHQPSGTSFNLPFVVERAFEAKSPTYVVTLSQHPDIKVGAVVERWNGTPVELIVGELAEDVAASNVAARRALAVRFLTARPATRFDPPTEQIVSLDLRAPDGTMSIVSVPWGTALMMPVVQSMPLALQLGQGVDTDLLNLNQVTFKTLAKVQPEWAAVPYPNVQSRTVQHDGQSYGYLRIRDFSVTDADDFAAHVASVVKMLPPAGLIIDLRGNPGGYIKAGELLLQLLTSKRITPEGFRFRASDAVGHILATSETFSTFKPTVEQGTRLGEEHSGTFPIEGDEESFNGIGQIYSGPSILIVDALTFSTADIFTAGYIDHKIGTVVCTDENVSAGGANNWRFDVLRALMPGFVIAADAEAELRRGQVGAITIAGFAVEGQSVTAAAQVRSVPWDLGDLWEITENGRTYRVGKTPEFRLNLAVYFREDNRFVIDLPAGVGFEFSIRQATRSRDAQGLVLEDDGVTADHYYRMTRGDVLASNQDLIAFACALFSQPSGAPA